MGKRKTRKEKIKSSLRNQMTVSPLDLQETSQTAQHIVYTARPLTQPTTSTYAISINDYQHILLDLKKTTITVSALIGLQIVLFALLKFRLFTIPFLNY